MEEALVLAGIFFFFGVIILVMIWFYKTWFRDRIRVKVCVDNGMRIKCYGAEPVDYKDGYLILKSKAFKHEIMVPKDSYRIIRSRIWGDYHAYLVDGMGSPKIWSNDALKEKLSKKDFWQMKKYLLGAEVLGYIRWLPIIKWFLVIIGIMVVLNTITNLYLASQIHPTVVVKIPYNMTHPVTNTTTTTTVTPPPPPG